MKKIRITLMFCIALILLFGCKTKGKKEFVQKNNQTLNDKTKIGGQTINDLDQVQWVDGKLKIITIEGEIYADDINNNEKLPANVKHETSGSERKTPGINIDIQGLEKNMYAYDYYISIDNYTYDITPYYDEYYKVDFDFKCAVLKKYRFSSSAIHLKYKVFDGDGYTIEDGVLSCYGDKYNGEKFKFQDSIRIKKGNYIIKFFDNMRVNGIYY